MSLFSLFYLLLFPLVYGNNVKVKVPNGDPMKLHKMRIVGGNETTIEANPYIASLHFFHYHVCGASILSDRWLLTAAHCTTLDMGILFGQNNPTRGFTVRFGSNLLEQGGEQWCVLRIHDYPQFLISEPVGYDYDISLLYLEKSLVFSNTIQPIRLPDDNEVYPSGTIATTLGWGVTSEGSGSLAETLRRVDVPLVTRERCDELYSAQNIPNYITETMICAGYDEGGQDACGGDSGGPLVTNNTLIGVVSFGLGCARPLVPGVYASVQHVRDWIRNTTSL